MMTEDQKLAAFTREIEASEPSFPFDKFAAALKALPDAKSYVDRTVELSAQAQQFLQELDELRARQPLLGLKLATLLSFNPAHHYYKTSFFEAITHRLNRWLLDDALPRRMRIDWGMHYWKNCPRWLSSPINAGKDVFVTPLLALLAQEAVEDGDYVLQRILEVRDSKTHPQYVFALFDPSTPTIELARILKDKDPAFYAGALAWALWKVGDDAPSPAERLAISRELWAFLRQPGSPSFLSHRSVLHALVHFGCASEPWFDEAVRELWAAAQAADDSKRVELGTIHAVAVNGVEGHVHTEQAFARFIQWADGFTALPLDADETFVNHAHELIATINGTLHAEHPLIRNRTTPVPDRSRVVDYAEDAYWRMVSWLRSTSRRHLFLVLAEGIEMPTFTVDLTRALAGRAESEFLAGFESFAQQNVSDCTAVVARMVGRSGYSGIDIQIRKVLEQIFGRFWAINREAASQALSIGLRSENERMRLWHPKPALLDPDAAGR